MPDDLSMAFAKICLEEGGILILKGVAEAKIMHSATPLSYTPRLFPASCPSLTKLVQCLYIGLWRGVNLGSRLTLKPSFMKYLAVCIHIALEKMRNMNLNQTSILLKSSVASWSDSLGSFMYPFI